MYLRESAPADRLTQLRIKDVLADFRNKAKVPVTVMLGVFTSSVVKKYVTIVKSIGIWKPVTGETKTDPKPETKTKYVLSEMTLKSQMFLNKNFFFKQAGNKSTVCKTLD